MATIPCKQLSAVPRAHQCTLPAHQCNLMDQPQLEPNAAGFA